MERTISDFNVIAGAMDHAVAKGAFTISELKQIIPAIEGLKDFIESQASPSTGLALGPNSVGA
jgi:hypothetical protein